MSAVKVILVVVLLAVITKGCLITNCPRGGKRSGNAQITVMQENNTRRCLSCGPGLSGQCFGPGICCGPFGCLLSTVDTVRCQRDGLFEESEPCIAGFTTCRKNSGRCAVEGVCCTQDSCHSDSSCQLPTITRNMVEEKPSRSLDLYSLLNNYQAEYAADN